MKKNFIITSLILFTSMRLFACDICGCGVGSYYLGILPDFNKRFIGLRYQYNSLETHLGPQGERTALSADETYRIAELWGAWNIGSRVRVMAILPYNFNHREVPGAGTFGSKKGIGDIAVMAYYKVFEGGATTSDSKLFNHSLWAGVGIKTPTGKYDNSERSTVGSDAPNNFQLGTGSADFTLNMSYDARLMDLGLNLNVLYKINTENKYEYRYGNKFTGNALFYYKFLIDMKLRISPNAGIMYERAAQDVEYNTFNVGQSGGHITSAVTGLELNYKKVSAGVNYQIPFSQNLAGSRVNAGNRLMTHVSFAF